MYFLTEQLERLKTGVLFLRKREGATALPCIILRVRSPCGKVPVLIITQNLFFVKIGMKIHSARDCAYTTNKIFDIGG